MSYMNCILFVVFTLIFANISYHLFLSVSIVRKFTLLVFSIWVGVYFLPHLEIITPTTSNTMSPKATPTIIAVWETTSQGIHLVLT